MINLKASKYALGLIEGYISSISEPERQEEVKQLLEWISVVDKGLTSASKALVNMNIKLSTIRINIGENNED